MRKGICKNIGPCTKANSEERQEIIDDFAPFECIECGQLLQEVVDEKPKLKLPKWVIPATAGIILFSLLFIFVPQLIKKGNDNKKIATYNGESTKLPNKAPDIKDDNNRINQEAISGNKDQSAPPVKPRTEFKEREINKLTSDVLTANSLEDGLRKIGDTKYSIESRKVLLPKVLSKFENSTVMVTVSMNNNKYEYFTVDKYLNRILIQGIKNISVKKETKNNAGLVNELSVNE